MQVSSVVNYAHQCFFTLKNVLIGTGILYGWTVDPPQVHANFPCVFAVLASFLLVLVQNFLCLWCFVGHKW